ncbi:hypothetical protein CHH59_21490 [Shouchella clausii]|uniref:Uncharacterized protein n=1 Tax=Shouchella clausii TaxID=79880 RepID=A0A268NTS7_SHOCL|nr:hypothetical protein [Shouchella clausii]PAE86659.1 hypothetical protein CHH72_22370 [Shouchella clausii]PAF11845.1 hypothetical protein CHH59_21490 [Shouchella clausii]
MIDRDKSYTTDELLTILNKYNVTNSKQMAVRLIRTGKIKGTMKLKKEGYSILGQDIITYLEGNSVSYWREEYKNLLQKYFDLKHDLNSSNIDDDTIKEHVVQDETDSLKIDQDSSETSFDDDIDYSGFTNGTLREIIKQKKPDKFIPKKANKKQLIKIIKEELGG